METVVPFRWDIAKRSQLGKLLDELEPGWVSEIQAEMYRAASGRDWLSVDHSLHITEWFQRELVRCTARVVAFSDNSDLYFVGRSLESMYDFLSGLLFDTSWRDRLNLLHFSMSRVEEDEVKPQALNAMKQYMAQIGLAPAKIAQRERPLTLVDIVATGETFGKLVRILKDWCLQTNRDWVAVQHKMRIIGLPQRTKTSPNTRRWQQWVDWISLIEPGNIKNVSVPSALFHYFGAAQSKTTESYTPWRWGDPEVMEPKYDPRTRMALRMAVSLFDEGCKKEVREGFAREMSKQTAMQYAWFRGLAQELK